MGVYVGDRRDSLGQPTLVPYGLGDGTDTGTEGVRGGQEGLPETVHSRPLRTRGWGGHKD